jgi:hypothetical protein
MEHDKNVVINDDKTVVNADPEETTPNPYVLTHNMCVAHLKQRFAKVEGNAHEL